MQAGQLMTRGLEGTKREMDEHRLMLTPARSAPMRYGSGNGYENMKALPLDQGWK